MADPRISSVYSVSGIVKIVIVSFCDIVWYCQDCYCYYCYLYLAHLVDFDFEERLRLGLCASLPPVLSTVGDMNVRSYHQLAGGLRGTTEFLRTKRSARVFSVGLRLSSFLSPWSLILGPQSLVLSPQSSVLSSRSSILGPWSSVLDSRSSILNP